MATMCLLVSLYHAGLGEIDIYIQKQGRIQDFKLGGRQNCWGISYEKSRFYAKKSYFVQF